MGEPMSDESKTDPAFDKFLERNAPPKASANDPPMEKLFVHTKGQTLRPRRDKIAYAIGFIILMFVIRMIVRLLFPVE